MKTPFPGLVVHMITPFDESRQPDPGRTIRFGSDLLSNGVNGLSLFGTTPEGQPLSASNSMIFLDTLITGGFQAGQSNGRSGIMRPSRCRYYE